MNSSSTRHGLAGLRGAPSGHEVAPPVGSPTSLYLPGDDPLRVLLVGDGPAVGYTVVSHELALAGCIARTLASSTPRGIILDIRADPRMSPQDAASLAVNAGIDRYDAIVMTLGTHDAIRQTSARSWVGGMVDLVHRLDRMTRGRIPIAIGSVPELFTLRSAPALRRAEVRTHADMLNLALATAPLPVSATFVDLSTPPATAPETPRGRRERWARALVTGLGPVDSIAPRSATSASRVSERRRQDALHRTGVLNAPCPRAIDEIVGAVQRSLGAPVVAMNFIDDSRLWVKASRGMPVESAERSQSLCDHTIRDNRTLVVPNATADARFRDLPFVTGPDGITSYLGHPVESPEGERVGSLCILDRRERHFSRNDSVVLQELAFRVQNELYALA